MWKFHYYDDKLNQELIFGLNITENGAKELLKVGGGDLIQLPKEHKIDRHINEHY